MSGAIWSGESGAAFPDGFVPRTTFGTRRPAVEHRFASRSVDRSVADLRRRIRATDPAPPNRLPWTIGGTFIVGVSAMLWLDAFKVATTLAHALARVF